MGVVRPISPCNFASTSPLSAVQDTITLILTLKFVQSAEDVLNCTESIFEEDTCILFHFPGD